MRDMVPAPKAGYGASAKDGIWCQRQDGIWCQRQRRDMVPAPKTGYGASAKGAEYDSQGQALSEAKRVAPG